MRRWIALGFLLLAALPCPAAKLPPSSLAGALPACQCPPEQPTLRQELERAEVVLVGTFAKSSPGNPKAGEARATDFIIDKRLRSHALVAGLTKITLKEDLDADTKPNFPHLLVCAVVKGRLQPYLAIPVKPGSALPKYVGGILKNKDKKLPARLRFYCDYLNHADSGIRYDAEEEFYRTFSETSYPTMRAALSKLPEEKLLKWLGDPKTPAERRGFLALLLGHCARDKDRAARLVLSHLNELEKDGHESWEMLVSHTLLQPKAGWEHVRHQLENASGESLQSYDAVQAVRFFAQHPTDAVSRRQCIETFKLILARPKVADLVIEDLRILEQWDLTDQILALAGKKSDGEFSLHQKILRFALNSPSPKAKQFVERERKRDPDSVKVQEEYLKAEREEKVRGKR
jgi:hypothetical protein